jgi:hypothetical protein
MPEQPMQQDPINSLLGEFSTRLNEIEEKQRLIKDRILLIGENLISTKEESLKQDFEIKRQLKQIEFEVRTLKQLMARVVNELPNFARKSELEILENQAKIFQPLEFASIKDVKDIVRKELKKTIKTKKT